MSKNILSGSRPLLPAALTSYDFLKAFALLLMLVDHIGYFFYTDELWWRAVGRFSAPVWLFLVGYARSRDLSPRMWIAVIILTLFNFGIGAPLLPLTILATMIACRIALDPLMESIARNPKSLYPIALILFVLTFLSFAVLEYGTAAMLMVMAGCMVRNRDALPFTRNQVVQFVGIAAILYAFIQAFVFFAFDPVQKAGVMLGTLGVALFLTTFRPYEYPALTEKMPAPLAWLVRLCGRHTLEIYVIHLILLRVAAMYMGYQHWRPFTLHIFE